MPTKDYRNQDDISAHLTFALDSMLLHQRQAEAYETNHPAQKLHFDSALRYRRQAQVLQRQLVDCKKRRQKYQHTFIKMIVPRWQQWLN